MHFDFKMIEKLLPFLKAKSMLMIEGKIYMLKAGDYSKLIAMLKGKGVVEGEKDITEINDLIK